MMSVGEASTKEGAIIVTSSPAATLSGPVPWRDWGEPVSLLLGHLQRQLAVD